MVVHIIYVCIYRNCMFDIKAATVNVVSREHSVLLSDVSYTVDIAIVQRLKRRPSVSRKVSRELIIVILWAFATVELSVQE